MKKEESSSCKSCKEKSSQSRRSRQRFRRRQIKQEEKTCQREQLIIAWREEDIVNRVNAKVRKIYGYVPDINLSYRSNALNVFLSCPSNILNSRLKNLAFHNLCENQVMPAHVRSLLGLGLNFCMKPKISSFHTFDLKRFNNDYDRKIMFSGAPATDDKPLVLYKSNPNWNADLPESQEILRCRCDFDAELRLLFATKRVQNTLQQPNLLPF